MEEVQPHKIQPRLLFHDPALVNRISVRVEDRKVDPVEACTEARAPDDVGHVQRAAVDQYGPAIPHAIHSGDATHAQPSQLPVLHAYEGATRVQHLAAYSAPQRCAS